MFIEDLFKYKYNPGSGRMFIYVNFYKHSNPLDLKESKKFHQTQKNHKKRLKITDSNVFFQLLL